MRLTIEQYKVRLFLIRQHILKFQILVPNLNKWIENNFWVLYLTSVMLLYNSCNITQLYSIDAPLGNSDVGEVVTIFGCWWQNLDLCDIYWMLVPNAKLYRWSWSWLFKWPEASPISLNCRWQLFINTFCLQHRITTELPLRYHSTGNDCNSKECI